MYARKKVIDVLAIATCGVWFILLSAFLIAILSENGLTIEFNPETGKERSVALSVDKDSDYLRSARPLPDGQTSSLIQVASK